MSKQGQGKAENTCSQLGKQLHVQGSPFSGGFATLALPDCLLRGDPGTGRQRGRGRRMEPRSDGCPGTRGPRDARLLHRLLARCPPQPALLRGPSPGKDTSPGLHLDPLMLRGAPCPKSSPFPNQPSPSCQHTPMGHLLIRVSSSLTGEVIALPSCIQPLPVPVPPGPA